MAGDMGGVVSNRTASTHGLGTYRSHGANTRELGSVLTAKICRFRVALHVVGVPASPALTSDKYRNSNRVGPGQILVWARPGWAEVGFSR